MLTARSLLQTLWLQCRRGCCRTRGSLKRKMSVRPRGSLLPDALLRGQLSCLSPHVTQAAPCFTRPVAERLGPCQLSERGRGRCGDSAPAVWEPPLSSSRPSPCRSLPAPPPRRIWTLSCGSEGCSPCQTARGLSSLTSRDWAPSSDLGGLDHRAGSTGEAVGMVTL